MVDNRTALTAILAVLALLALGISAATLDSATTTNSGGFGAGSASGVGIGNDQGSKLPLNDDPSNSSGAGAGVSVCVTFLTRPLVQLALLGGVVVFFGAAYRVMDSGLLSGIFTVSALVPFAVIYLALTSCGAGARFPGGIPSGGNNSSLGANGGNAGLGAAGEAVSAPTALAALLLVIAVIGSVALLFVSTGDDDDAADDEPETPDPEQRAAVGMAAGEAADRLEADADLENEVFRAWREMTDLLDVDRPESSTPAEFAAAAVEAGMDREDVLALTGVFEEVRYGGAEPTPDREERAIAALRHIEGAYGADADDAGDTDGRGSGGEP